MGSRTYRTTCIVLDKTKLKETDLILTLLTEQGSRVQAVAKGARKPGSRLAGRCELLNTADLLLARGRSLDIVSQAELLSAPVGVHPGYESLMAGSAIAEVAKHCCFEDVADPFIFDITSRALEVLGALGDQAHRDIVVAAYSFKVLAHIGYRPDYSSCVSCGDPALSYFSAQAGGLLCASCASSVSGAEPVDDATIQWLRALISLRFDELAAHEASLSQSSLLLSLCHAWASTHLDARFRSLEFLLGR